MVKKVTMKKGKNKVEIDKALVDNFVALQKVFTNLAVKMDNLTDQIAKLLNLFEISARSFAEKQAGKDIKKREADKEFLQKVDSLLEQNKTIARGLTLMEEKMRERIKESMPEQTRIERQRIMPRKLPRY